MTHAEFVQMAKDTAILCAYDHFAEGEPPAPPFLVYYIAGSDNFYADGELYGRISNFVMELYTDVKEPPLEHQVESVLASQDVLWNKTEGWLEAERLYEVRYDFQEYQEVDDA